MSETYYYTIYKNGKQTNCRDEESANFFEPSPVTARLRKTTGDSL